MILLLLRIKCRSLLQDAGNNSEPVYDLSVTYFAKQHLVKKIRGSLNRLPIHLLISSFLRHFSFSGRTSPASFFAG
jgi:hypothetical protein